MADLAELVFALFDQHDRDEQAGVRIRHGWCFDDALQWHAVAPFDSIHMARLGECSWTTMGARFVEIARPV